MAHESRRRRHWSLSNKFIQGASVFDKEVDIADVEPLAASDRNGLPFASVKTTSSSIA